MATELKSYVKKLLKIVNQMQIDYPQKKFTLDGRLVGDIGEVLAAERYDICLNEGLTKHHDAVCSDGKHVQIKSTMKNSLTFPCDHVPSYVLGIKIHENGEIEEIFNGPGQIIKNKLKNRAKTKTNLHLISNSTLKILNKAVPEEERIIKKKN